jgi:hypothetical protein
MIFELLCRIRYNHERIYPILPSIENSLDYDDDEQKDPESKIRTFGIGVAKRFIADDANDSRHRQHATKPAEKVTEAAD